MGRVRGSSTGDRALQRQHHLGPLWLRKQSVTDICVKMCHMVTSATPRPGGTPGRTSTAAARPELIGSFSWAPSPVVSAACVPSSRPGPAPKAASGGISAPLSTSSAHDADDDDDAAEAVPAPASSCCSFSAAPGSSSSSSTSPWWLLAGDGFSPPADLRCCRWPSVRSCCLPRGLSLGHQRVGLAPRRLLLRPLPRLLLLLRPICLVPLLLREPVLRSSSAAVSKMPMEAPLSDTAGVATLR